MTIVVCDTGPILHLHEAGLLDWLGAMGSVHTPVAVDRELALLIPGWPGMRPNWLLVQSIQQPVPEPLQSICRQGGLGPGEIEAIALSIELRVDWLLTDDTAARVIAESTGLEAHGSLGIVLFRAAQGQVAGDVARTALDRLAATSLWLSKPILARAKAALDQILRRE